jgi:AcrR family transcriptional regulator
MPIRSPARPAKTRLTREVVTAAALAVVDADGLPALTMRRLGSELGVDPMAAYRHVDRKAGLLDAIVEAVLAEIEIPARTGPWDAWFARLARNFRATLLRHPHTLPVVSTRPPVTPAAWQPVEAALAVLVECGFDLQAASDAVDCMTYLVLGHVTAEAGIGPGPDSRDVDASHVASMGVLDPSAFPHVAAAATTTVHDPTAIFELGLDGMLRALRAQRRAAGSGR